MKWPAAIEDLRARIDACSRRERLLLFGAALAFVLLAWEFALRAPLYARWQGAVQQAADARADTARLQASAQELRRELESAGGESGRSAVAALQDRLADADEALTQRTLRVISPGQMVAVLRDMVAASEALALVSLRNTGVEPVIEEERGDADGAADVPRVYRHRVEVVIEGEYLDMLAYLERLEGLHWQFQWDRLQIATVDYPRARATISLSTLSLAEDWIGV